MQPVGPYRFTETLGVCPVGTAWWAIDAQDRLVTIAVLEGAAAADQPWREAFADAANAMALTPGGQRYVNADFAAAKPWVAYPSEDGMGAERLFLTLGMELHPAESEAQVLIPDSGTVSEPSYPVTGAPTSAEPNPTSGAPLPWAIAAQPTSGLPVSPVAVPATPVAPDPLDPSRGPRITPTERRPRNGLRVGGVVLTAVLAGVAGLLAGSALGGDAEPTADPSASASATPGLYEATQSELNKAKFDADLLPLAEPWLSRLADCAADTEAGGPRLPKDEKRHVFCRYGNVSVHFARYESPTKKDAARSYRQQMAILSGPLAPGMREGSRTTGGVSGATGSYVEYAGKPADGPVMCGIWWDRDDSVGTVYFETPCEAGIAGNWDALRDLWRRYS